MEDNKNNPKQAHQAGQTNQTEHQTIEQEAQIQPEQNGCCNELAAVRDRCLYVTAEFENYKKRVDREKKEWIAVAQSDVLEDFLPIIDVIERALGHIEHEDLSPEEKSHLEGFNLIAKEFFKLLEKYHVSEITQVDQFDPALHEALMQVESDQHESGAITQVLQKGYKHKERVIRPAKVSVAK